MGYVIAQLTAPDAYTKASTLENVPITAVTLDVVNQAIVWQLKLGTYGGSGYWEENVETPMIPGSRRISGDPGEIIGIRFRALTRAANIPAGSNQAVVTVRTVP